METQLAFKPGLRRRSQTKLYLNDGRFSCDVTHKQLFNSHGNAVRLSHSITPPALHIGTYKINDRALLMKEQWRENRIFIYNAG